MEGTYGLRIVEYDRIDPDNVEDGSVSDLRIGEALHNFVGSRMSYSDEQRECCGVIVVRYLNGQTGEILPQDFRPDQI